MNKKSFKPQTLRGILFVLFAFIIIGCAGLFYFGLGEIRKFATEVNHTVADAEASGGQVQALQNLKNQLTQSEALINKANLMFASPANYQTQAINDIRTYASASGVTVTKTSFDDTNTGPTRIVSISLQSPTSYTGLIKFLDGIEGNIPKMQVSKITLSHVPEGGADVVKIDDIKITIAVR